MNGACPLIPMKTGNFIPVLLKTIVVECPCTQMLISSCLIALDLSGTTPSDGPALSTVGEMLATAPITTVSPESSSRRPSPTPRAPPPSVAMVIAPTTSPPETLPCLPAPLIPPSITPYPTLPWTQAIQHPGAGNVMYVPVTIAPGMPPNQPGSMPWAFIVAPPDFQYILSPSSPHQNPPPTVPMGVSVMPVTSEPLPRSLDEQASNTAQSVSRSGAQPPLSLSTLDSNSVYQMYTRADVIDSAPNTTPLDQLQDLLHQCSASPMISEPGAMTPDATAYRDRESSLGSSSDSSTATMSQPATPGLLPFPSSARRPSFDSTLCAELSASSTSDIPVTPGTHEYQACWKWHLSSSLDDLEYFSLGPQGYDC